MHDCEMRERERENLSFLDEFVCGIFLFSLSMLDFVLENPQ